MKRVGMMLVAGALLAQPAAAQSLDKKAIGVADIKKMVAAAEAEARKLNQAVTIAIADDSGTVIFLQKGDDAPAASIDIAQGKARTSARLRSPTKRLADAVAGGGGAGLLSIPGIVPLEGGLPVTVDGKVIGAIAASGAPSGALDAQIAQAGLDALAKK